MNKTDDTFRRLKYHEVKAAAGPQGRYSDGAKALWYCFDYDIPVAKIDDCKLYAKWAFAAPNEAQELTGIVGNYGDRAGALKYCRYQYIPVVLEDTNKYGAICGFIVPYHKMRGCKSREAEELRLTADYRRGVERAGVVARVSSTGA